MTPSRKAAMRTRDLPAVSSMPSLSFSTRWTAPMCCQPCAQPGAQKKSDVAARAPAQRTDPDMTNLLTGLAIRGNWKIVLRFKRRANVQKMRWLLRLPCGGGLRPRRGSAEPNRDRRGRASRSEEHTSELQSLAYLVCRLLLEKKK